jgi:hypothetical protein
LLRDLGVRSARLRRRSPWHGCSPADHGSCRSPGQRSGTVSKRTSPRRTST